MTSGLRAALVAQFRKPHGLLGRLAGLIMRHRSSNRQRNRWMVELMELEPAMRVLEIGCGPGYALRAMLANCPDLSIHALDHSEVMIAIAKSSLPNGAKVAFSHGDVTLLETLPAGFDRICCANVHQFWLDEKAILKTCWQKLEVGGKLFITYLPRSQNPTNAMADQEAERLQTLLLKVGFAEVNRYDLPLKPTKAVCVVAVKGK